MMLALVDAESRIGIAGPTTLHLFTFHSRRTGVTSPDSGSEPIERLNPMEVEQ